VHDISTVVQNYNKTTTIKQLLVHASGHEQLLIPGHKIYLQEQLKTTKTKTNQN